ncbi:MAG: ELWxxDGT repeat protein [Acidobacteriota bacterium]
MKRNIVLCVWMLVATAGWANERLLVDVNTTAAGSAPADYTAWRGDIVFTATVPTLGRELWTSGGDAATTRLLVDVLPGDRSSSPADLTAFGTNLAFSAIDPSHGREPWSFDGTSAAQLGDLRPGPEGSDPRHFAALGDRVVFFADDGDTGTELWVSDGTPTGTTRITDLDIGDGDVRLLTVIGSRVFFAPTAFGDQDVRVTDVDTGVTTVLDIEVVFDDQAAVIDDVLYLARDGEDQLVFTNGTPPGTGTVRLPGALRGNSSQPWMTVAEGRLFFSLFRADVGFEPWSFAPEQGTAQLIADLTPGAASSELVGFRTLDDEVYVTRFVGATSEVVRLTTNSATSVPSTTGNNLFVLDAVSLDGGAGFLAIDAEDLLGELDFVVGQIVADVAVIYGVPVDPNAPIGAADERLWFTAEEDDVGTEPWSAMLGGAPLRVADLNAATRSSPAITQALTLDTGFTLFSTADRTIWRTNGTAASTLELAAGARKLERAGRRGVFSASIDGVRHLWKTAGTPATTRPLLALEAGTWPSASTGALAFYIVSEPSVASEPGATTDGPDRLFIGPFNLALWVTDGTVAGTRKLHTWQSPAIPSAILVAGDRIVIGIAREDDKATSLLISDGTVSGTSVIAAPLDLVALPGPFKVIPEILLPGASLDDGRTVFSSLNDGVGLEPWITDGTAAGTGPLFDSPPPQAIEPLDYLSTGDAIFFRNDTPDGLELWVTDGSHDGTTKLIDLGADSKLLGAAHGTLLFRNTDASHGAELWVSDGVTAERLVDIEPGALSSSPDAALEIGGDLFFAARNAAHGRELWKSDGTVAGTQRVTDVRPGAGSSDPEPWVVAPGYLLFTADDGTHGREPWVLPDL